MTKMRDLKGTAENLVNSFSGFLRVFGQYNDSLTEIQMAESEVNLVQELLLLCEKFKLQAKEILKNK